MSFFRKILSVILTISMLLIVQMPVFGADGGGTEKGEELTESDYRKADLLIDEVCAIGAAADNTDDENGGVQQYSTDQDDETADDAESKVDMIVDYLEEQDTVKDGSVEVTGDGSVFWQTEDGITCNYSTQLEKLKEEAKLPEEQDDAEDHQVVSYEPSYALRSAQHGSDVYLFQPYYGLDSSFTRQYQTEADRVAKATEGTYNYYKGNYATVDAIADAIEDGGVVFFDSHGSTDYSDGKDDYTSKATTSYLCLQSGEGLTTADYEDKHASYGGSGANGMSYYQIDGTVIANHMEKSANNGLIWMAICLGMATDGLEAPLMEKGAGVVYGYSQSVTFVGDYSFEDAFFTSLLGGSTVNEAAAYMKKTCGEWDYSAQIANANGMPSSYIISTEAEAVQKKAAFPIIVSDEDPYPGHGKVDAVQQVDSSWNLLKKYDITVNTDADESAGTIIHNGMTVTAVPADGYYASGYTVTPEGAATVKQDGNKFSISAMREDCTVTIHFAQKTAATVHFSVPNGVQQPDMNSYIGDAITLPSPEGTPTADSQDYHFTGWSESVIGEPEETADYMRAGEQFVSESEETTLYAVYQYFATPEGKTPSFAKVTSAPGEDEDWSGTYVITGGDRALLCDGSLNGAEMGSAKAASSLAGAGMTADESGKLTGASGAYAVQIVRIPNTSQYSIKLAGTIIPTYLACRTNNDQLNTSESANSSLARWTISYDTESGAAVIKNVRYPARSLRYSTTEKYFRCFTASAKNTEDIVLYRGDNSSMWYTTVPVSDHEHNYVESARQEASCDTAGWIEYSCSVCGISYREEVAALGHSFTTKASAEEAEAATCTAPAKYYVQCDRCDAVDKTKTVASGNALGHDYKDGVCTRCGAKQPSSGGSSGGGGGGGSSSSGGSGGGGSSAQTPTVTPTPAPEEPTSGGATFKDIPENAYYSEAVAWAVKKNIASGVSTDEFRPDASCTRAQMATLIWRAAGSPEPESAVCPFSDVHESDYFYKAVIWAAEKNIVNGIGNSMFDPSSKVTRAQAVSMLWRYSGSEKAAGTAESFNDVQAGAYYAEAVGWASEKGIVKGTAASQFSPSASCTRAQIVTFLYRAAA